MIYGDLVRVIKEPSTVEKPFEYEKHLIEHRKLLNSKYGFKDLGIEIPATIKDLQTNYDKSYLENTDLLS
jgi:hypothetical protein